MNKHRTLNADRRKDPAVQKAIELRKLKKRSDFGKVVGTFVGLTTIAFVAVNVKKDESPQPLALPVGSKAQIDVSRAQGELRPDVRERVMRDKNIVPRTLKDLRKP